MRSGLATALLIVAAVASSGCVSSVRLPELEASALSARRAAVFAGAEAVDLTVSDTNFEYHVTLGPLGILALGTAFPVTDDGFLLTAAHVLDTPGGTICVYLHAPAGQVGAFLPADLVYVDPVSDIAVLKVARAIELPFRLADRIPGIGAEAVSTSTSRGSQRGRVLDVVTPAGVQPKLVITRGAKAGDSGGAVLDADGRAVGVITQAGLDWRWSGVERIAIATGVDANWWASVLPSFTRDARYRPAKALAGSCRLSAKDPLRAR